MSILARRQVRLAALAAFQAIPGITLDSPGDWDTPPARLPNVKLRAPSERKTAIAKSQPDFTTTVTLELLLTAAGETEDAAQDAIEGLGQQVENAIFGNVALVALLQQFPTVSTEVEISANGKQHFARARMQIDCELFEQFDPTEINPLAYVPLQQVEINVDTAAPFDASGTYANSSFPQSVTPAPRSEGPDGRNEATLQIDLT